MNVSEIMTSHPVVIYQGETLDAALMKMWQVVTAHLPVLSYE
jgi:CBS domain-containing protein